MAAKPLLLFGLVACLLGCQLSPDQDVVGAWTANRKLSQIPDFGPNAPFEDGGRRIRNAIYSTQLKLSADHTFILSGLRQIGGKWSLKKNVLTLHPITDETTKQWRLSTEIREFRVNADLTRMSVTIPIPMMASVVIVLDKTA